MDSVGIVDEIRGRLDIVEVISEHVPLKRAGRNHKGLCPFHPEKTPSFMVSQDKQIFHCFGCGAGGDLFAFVMRQEGISFREALEVLARRAGVELSSGPGGAERGLKERLRAANAQAMGFFRDCLRKSAEVTGYLKRRGLSAESVKAFSLGYAPAGWHVLMEHLKARGFGEDLLIKAGLAARGSKGPYDVFRARLMFPILDIRGEAIAFGGRVLDSSTPKYLNSPDTPLFRKGETLYGLYQGRDEIRKKDCALVVEGYLDAIKCHQQGIRNAVAPLGTALTEGHVKRLASLAGNVLLVFDGDEAGVSAARRSLSIILGHDLRARILMLPEGEDPDSILEKKGAEHLSKLMDAALSPVEFVLGCSAPGPGAVREALSLIDGVKSPLLRDEFILELSERSGARELAIREELARLRKAGPLSTAAKAASGAAPYNEEVLLLSAALAAPEKAEEILSHIKIEDIRDSAVKRIFGKLRRATSPRHSPMDAAETEEDKALVSRLSLNPGFDPGEIDRNIEDCVKVISRRRLDEQILRARASGDLKLLSRLYTERQRLMQGTP